jgi:anti-anti-sigma factor
MSLQIQVLEPEGIVDSLQAARFCQDVEQLLSRKVDVIVVDFRHVALMDSSGLGALTQALKMVQENRAQLLLCSFNPQVQTFFELTGMDRVFEILEGREELEHQIFPQFS